MHLKFLYISLIFALLTGCSAKTNFVVLSPANDGAVGALEVTTEQGSKVLSEEGKAIYLTDKKSPPSSPVPIDKAETQSVFQDALRVHPSQPESFLLYFHINSNELTDESKKLIATILSSIKNRESKDISVIGHTDRTGSDEYNRKLSLERAQVVYEILRGEKVDPKEMTIFYHGEGNPLIPTADNIAEPRNRRVEVMVR